MFHLVEIVEVVEIVEAVEIEKIGEVVENVNGKRLSASLLNQLPNSPIF